MKTLTLQCGALAAKARHRALPVYEVVCVLNTDGGLPVVG
jgi:hypothetical protein